MTAETLELAIENVKSWFVMNAPDHVHDDFADLMDLARLGFELQQDSEAYAAFNAKRFNKSMAKLRKRINMNIEVKKLEPTDRQLNLIQSVGVFEGGKLIATFVRLDDADLFAVMKRKEIKALAERAKENT